MTKFNNSRKQGPRLEERSNNATCLLIQQGLPTLLLEFVIKEIRALDTKILSHFYLLKHIQLSSVAAILAQKLIQGRLQYLPSEELSDKTPL